MTLDEIIAGCKRGENKYQKILFENYYSSMLIICVKYCEDIDEAKDILQDSFITIFDKVNTFKSELSCSFPAWMARIVRNKCVDYIRKNKKIKKIGLDDKHFNVVIKTETLLDLFGDKLTNAIEKLSPKYKQTIKMFYMEDKSCKEISEIMGIHIGTCKSNLHKGKLNIKKLILNL